MDSNYSLSDLAAVTGGSEGGFGGSAWWIIILFLFVFMGGNGNGLFGGGNDTVGQEILYNQRFDGISRQVDSLANGVADSTFALSNTIQQGNFAIASGIANEGRAMQTQMAECCCATNRNIDSVKYANAENTQKILDAISGNRMADMQNQINQLQLQASLCGVVRYPNAMTYNAGPSPFCGGCSC